MTRGPAAQWAAPVIEPGEAAVSVIVPCYNVASYVGRAIDSALGQTKKAVDVVVVDDGSTDGTAVAIAAYGDRVRMVSMGSNSGVSAARNRGAEEARGNWYLFLDADDYLDETALEYLSQDAEKGGCGVVFGGIRQYDESSGASSTRNRRDSAGEPPLPAIRGFWRAAIPTPGAALVHRSVHEAIGGFEKPWQPTEDRDYWMKCGVTTAFRCCEHPVLTKLKRSGSSRLNSRWIPYWGMRTQIEFIDWARERGIDVAFPGVSMRRIVDTSVRRATENGDREVLGKIVAYCNERRLRSYRLLLYKLTHRFEGLVSGYR